MPVDFKNKLFQKALWGYVPEEVDEYIAYVAGEYTRLEKRLNAIRAENAKIAAERNAMKSAADIPGVAASGPAPEPDGVSARLEEAEAVLARAGTEAESTLARAKEEAEAVLSRAKEEAEHLVNAARREAGSIREQAEEDAHRAAEEIRSGAEEESERLLADAKEAREAAGRERDALDALRCELAEREAGLDARIRDFEEDRRLLGEEREAFEREREGFSAEKAGLTASRDDADALREEAAEQLRESERILSGLSTAAARFRSDVAAFSSSMRSMAQSQLSAAERFGEDADRFLADVNAFSARNADGGQSGEDETGADLTAPDDSGSGDPFGFASAAMMIGELLKDLPDEPGEPLESQEQQEPTEPQEAQEPEKQVFVDHPASAESRETDELLAETAVSEHIAAETDRILDSLRSLTEEEPQEEPEVPTEPDDSAEPEEPAERNEPEESAEPEKSEEPDLPELSAHERSEAPDEADTAPDATAEKPEEQGEPDDSGEELDLPKPAEPEPGDEELEAVMKALSGISEDDSYDAILSAFQPDEEVDLKLAEDLEKKRRENFRRMMDEAAAERSAEKSGGKKEKRTARTTSAPPRNPEPDTVSLPDDGESDLEKEIAAAVEAAVRAKMDPGQALDEVFAELAREDEEAEEDLGAADGLFTEEPVDLPPDMLELLDFDEPGADAAAYTDHSLAEFTSGRKEPEPDARDDEE